MLENIDHNTTMEASRKHQLYIHQTNLFQPHKLGISAIAQSPNREFLAITRRYLNQKDINHPFTLIEIYEASSETYPKYIQTIVEYEDITGIGWTSGKHVITASRQAKINIYDITSGTKIKSTTTDFGPIVCMKLSDVDHLLVTGTEYGYVAVYRIGSKGKNVECVAKMVKINDSIQAIDFHVRQRTSAAFKKVSSPIKIVRSSKRKKADSSDGENTDNKNENGTPKEFLETCDVTIYGGSKTNVVSWDYHRKTIIETIIISNEVFSVLVLKNGDIAVGDSKGYLGIFDQNSFTCRQNEKVLDHGILCLAQNSDSSIILVSGQEPTIALFKISRASEVGGEYVLFEMLKDHNGHVTSATFKSKKDFFTCSLDGTIVRFKTNKSKGRKVLDRFITMPNFTGRIKFSCGNEVMALYGKSLLVYKLVESSEFRLAVSQNCLTRQSLEEPRKTCTLKVGSYIHSAVIDSKWICYATRKRLAIHRRSNLQQAETTAEKLPNCQILQLCCDGQYLIAGQQKKLFIIKLNGSSKAQDNQEISDDTSKNSVMHEIIFAYKTKGVVQQIIYQKHINQLIVACGSPRNFLYTFRFPSSTSDNKIEFLIRIGLPHSLSFIAYNSYDLNDANIYVYTTKDQLIKCDGLAESLNKHLVARFMQQSRIQGLPLDINSLGLLVISQKQCIVYEKDRMFKVDIEANEVINENSNYKYITTIDKSIFNEQDELLIISLQS